MKVTLLLSFSLLFSSLLPLAAQEQSSLSSQTMLLIGQGSPVLIGDEYKLVEEAAVAFENMSQAAAQDSIIIQAVSSYRSFDRQLAIWNRKFTKNVALGLTPDQNIKKITEYSTIPGTSRHHWGTDVDLIDGLQPKSGDVLVTKKFHGNGPYVKMRKWMDAHAVEYGFIRPYTSDDNRKGFYYEPWHYSYAPIAIPMLKAYLELNLNSVLLPEDLEGQKHIDKEFMTRYIEENILGINKILK